MKTLRVAIVVHGRFHAFELAAAIERAGHEVLVYTNYPKSEALRFGLDGQKVRVLVAHRVAMRLWVSLLGTRMLPGLRDFLLHEWFGRWAKKRVRNDGRFDVVHAFSGVAEPLLRTGEQLAGLVSIVRGSAHIREQARLLLAEHERSGVAAEIPSDWMIAREEREYALADRILVLSSFARGTFSHVPEFGSRVRLAPLGVDVAKFSALSRSMLARSCRLSSKHRLQVLIVGSVSTQKGAAAIVEALVQCRDRVDLRIVGDVAPVWRDRLRAVHADIQPRVRQELLPSIYAAADVFVLASVHDGYAMVLPQALASGLVVLASTRSAGPDLIEHGSNGLLFEPGAAAGLIAALCRVDSDRALAARLAEAAAATRIPDWADAARSWLDAHAPDAGLKA